MLIFVFKRFFSTTMRLLLFSLLCFAGVYSNHGALKNGDTGQSGPCTLGTHNNSQQLKCTIHGYFEVKQCSKDSCVCVDPRTGHEAPATRTVSKDVQPICGNCHLMVAEMISTNSLKILQCQANTGNYQAKQCKDDNYCYCVNEETGTPITTDKTILIKKNSELTCKGDERFASSIDSKPTSVNVDKSSLLSNNNNNKGNGNEKNEDKIEDAPLADPICRLPKDAGHACNNGRAGSVQWYFDVETFECLAFKHNGCGGNRNHFASISDCWSRCKLADFGSCAGLRTPAKNSKGENILCYTNGVEGEKCPSGYQCTMLAFFGICCHSETQEIYLRNYRPTCANGKQAKQIESAGVPMTLIGKSCDDKFCPQSTTCKKQEIFAHCCLN